MDNNTADDIAAIRAHMRERECELRKDADRLHDSGATLDAWALKLVADELDRYCEMLNRLEFQFRHAQASSHPVKGVNCDMNGNPVVDNGGQPCLTDTPSRAAHCGQQSR